jgi:hypothetical protein
MSVRCERCGKLTIGLIMSIFNTEMICIDCKEKEDVHPDYRRAKNRELEAVKQGNYNFKGIGKPNDL